ncbi:unnamed protein product, partial [Amoebophrya sp. A25]
SSASTAGEGKGGRRGTWVNMSPNNLGGGDASSKQRIKPKKILVIPPVQKLSSRESSDQGGQECTSGTQAQSGCPEASSSGNTDIPKGPGGDTRKQLYGGGKVLERAKNAAAKGTGDPTDVT